MAPAAGDADHQGRTRAAPSSPSPRRRSWRSSPRTRVVRSPPRPDFIPHSMQAQREPLAPRPVHDLGRLLSLGVRDGHRGRRSDAGIGQTVQLQRGGDFTARAITLRAEHGGRGTWRFSRGRTTRRSTWPRLVHKSPGRWLSRRPTVHHVPEHVGRRRGLRLARAQDLDRRRDRAKARPAQGLGALARDPRSTKRVATSPTTSSSAIRGNHSLRWRPRMASRRLRESTPHCGLSLRAPFGQYESRSKPPTRSATARRSRRRCGCPPASQEGGNRRSIVAVSAWSDRRLA